jgi:hypothetical protein
LTSEQILDKNAKRRMVEWDLERFKRDFPTLFLVIVDSIEQAGNENKKYREMYNRKHLLRN